MTWEELKVSDADVLLIAPCGFDLARTQEEMHWLTSRPDWNELRAVREGMYSLRVSSGGARASLQVKISSRGLFR